MSKRLHEGRGRRHVPVSMSLGLMLEEEEAAEEAAEDTGESDNT